MFIPNLFVRIIVKDSRKIYYLSVHSVIDPIVKEQGRLTMVSSSPTPIAGSGPVGE